MQGEAWTPERKAGLGAAYTRSAVYAPGRQPSALRSPGRPDRPPSPAPAVSGPASLRPPPASRLYFSPRHVTFRPSRGSHDIVATS